MKLNQVFRLTEKHIHVKQPDYRVSQSILADISPDYQQVYRFPYGYSNKENELQKNNKNI